MNREIEGRVESAKYCIDEQAQDECEEERKTDDVGDPDVSQVLELVLSHELSEVLYPGATDSAHDCDSHDVKGKDENVWHETFTGDASHFDII